MTEVVTGRGGGGGDEAAVVGSALWSASGSAQRSPTPLEAGIQGGKKRGGGSGQESVYSEFAAALLYVSTRSV